MNLHEIGKLVRERRDTLDSLTRMILHRLSQVFLRGNVGLVAP